MLDTTGNVHGDKSIYYRKQQEERDKFRIKKMEMDNL